MNNPIRNYRTLKDANLSVAAEAFVGFGLGLFAPFGGFLVLEVTSDFLAGAFVPCP